MEHQVCLCLCELSRYQRQWRLGTLLKGCKWPLHQLTFVDMFGKVWFVESENSTAPINYITKLTLDVLYVNTGKI